MKSLDDLIRFLLEEIALCGDHGQCPTVFALPIALSYFYHH